MAAARIGRNFSFPIASRIASAVQFAATHSVYPPFISIGELTTAQALMLSLFHSLLCEDVEAVLSLLHLAAYLPQLRSSFISIWLRDDYDFRQEDVAKVLSVLAQFIQDNGPMVPLPILIAMSGLEEKYDIFNFYHNSGDTTAQELLAYLNPLITRSTQAGPEGMQDQEVQTEPKVVSVAIQTTTENWQQPVTQSWHHSFTTTWQPSSSATWQQQQPQQQQQSVSQNIPTVPPPACPAYQQQAWQHPGQSTSSGSNSFTSRNWHHSLQSTALPATYNARSWQRAQPPPSRPLTFTSRTWQHPVQPQNVSQSASNSRTWQHPPQQRAVTYNSRTWHQPVQTVNSFAASNTSRPSHQPAAPASWATHNPLSIWHQPAAWAASNASRTEPRPSQSGGSSAFHTS